MFLVARGAPLGPSAPPPVVRGRWSLGCRDMVTIKIGEQIFTTDETLAEVEASVAQALVSNVTQFCVGRVERASGRPCRHSWRHLQVLAAIAKMSARMPTWPA